MMIPLQQSLILIGMMGCGKSRLGSMLAYKYDIMHYDVDTLIEKDENMSVANIFTEKGEEYFRALERAKIEYLCLLAPSIISAGGGTFIQDAIRPIIKKYMISVYMQCDHAILWERIKHKKGRPLLLRDDAEEYFKDLQMARHPIYKKADIIVPLEHGTHDENLAIIDQYIKAYMDETHSIKS